MPSINESIRNARTLFAAAKKEDAEAFEMRRAAGALKNASQTVHVHKALLPPELAQLVALSQKAAEIFAAHAPANNDQLKKVLAFLRRQQQDVVDGLVDMSYEDRQFLADAIAEAKGLPLGLKSPTWVEIDGLTARMLGEEAEAEELIG